MRSSTATQRLRRPLGLSVAGAVLAALVFFAESSAADTTTFQNLNPIRFSGHPGIPPPWAADLYPSTIDVTGVTGTITDLNVALHRVNCPINDENIGLEFPDDLDVVLVGPTGVSTVLMSDLFGQNVDGANTFTNLEVFLNDEAADYLPTDTNPFRGTDGQSVAAKPTDDDDDPDESPTSSPADPNNPGLYLDTFPAPGWPGSATGPAPNPPSVNPAGLSVFDGTDPNGTWKLYLADDFAGPEWCDILGGWTLQVTTGDSPEPPPPDTGSTTTSTASTTTTTQVPADLGVTLTGPATAKVGRKVSFSVAATNNGPATAQNVIITDNLPAEFTVTQVNRVKGMTCSRSGSLIQCRVDSLAAGKTVSVTISGSYSPAGTYTHSVGVGAGSYDNNASNNRAQVVTVVS